MMKCSVVNITSILTSIIKCLFVCVFFLISSLNFYENINLYFNKSNNVIAPDTLRQKEEIIFPGDKWVKSAPELQGIDSTKLKEAIRFLEENSGFDGVKELMVVRNGYLIWEGEEVDKVHGVWSVTKSFTSTVLGLLIGDGKANLNTHAKDIIPEMNDNYPNLELRHFTTMTSGYRAQGDEPRGDYTHGPSATPFIPGNPLFIPPGSKYAYWDSAMNQFANILTRIAGEPLEDFLKRRVFDPIGVNPDQWRWGDFGKFGGYKINGGAGNHGNHIFISAREIARVGHLFLNHGNWDGKQLIPEDWVQKASAVQVPSSLPLGHSESGLEGSGVYGFNWWVNGIKPNGERKWPHAPNETFSAWGHNNNNLFIIPEWNMVLVRLGMDQSDKEITDKINSQFLQKIGEAIK
ncbi:beta-lactamase family protein [Aliifodinibius sp. S!AR15-10]|uniref:serine hydrolase domain-containing protein n=1 Tax=Aliifodinibius sp. S!AR15-10 TaxID=2950437 RepID=UPI002863AC8C|nr:serine hydrolase [Aliifodinibius sp. S!AR15-10]MDR8389687.1 beta-lactamase family protein [Aliifodinibius sp. S!AR15-10]